MPSSFMACLSDKKMRRYQPRNFNSHVHVSSKYTGYIQTAYLDRLVFRESN